MPTTRLIVYLSVLHCFTGWGGHRAWRRSTLFQVIGLGGRSNSRNGQSTPRTSLASIGRSATTAARPQLLRQRLCLLKVRRGEAFAKRIVRRGTNRVRVPGPPQTSSSGSSTKPHTGYAARASVVPRLRPERRPCRFSVGHGWYCSMCTPAILLRSCARAAASEIFYGY